MFKVRKKDEKIPMLVLSVYKNGCNTYFLFNIQGEWVWDNASKYIIYEHQDYNLK
jgi:hypothetical protein